jgi:hypothetical protein
MSRARPIGITLVSTFAIICGLGEVVVGITGNYLGILSKNMQPSFSTALVGAFYSLGGFSLLTMRRWGAVLGILFLGAEILGRVYLVMAGITPSAGFDAIKILVGGIIALSLVIYVGSKWKEFN